LANKRRTFHFWRVLTVAALAGCVRPQIAVNRSADFTRIHRVAVASFSGSGGEVAADMMAQDLLARGADVVERPRLDAVLHEQQLAASGVLDLNTIKKVGKILGIDALFVGSVIDNTPSQSYLVNSGGPGSINVNTVTPVGNSTVYSQGSALGVPGSQVVTSAANVGLIARMVDVETGSIVWSGRMTYEGFDTQSAMSEVTASFADSLIPLWPSLSPVR
jgi:curli biogenesis system outer membrane secretion channel CsgG